MSSPPDPLPSDEAVEVARNLLRLGGTYGDILTAAYAIDMPRREAEVRAATLREVEQFLRAERMDRIEHALTLYKHRPRHEQASAVLAALGLLASPDEKDDGAPEA